MSASGMSLLAGLAERILLGLRALIIQFKVFKTPRSMPLNRLLLLSEEVGDHGEHGLGAGRGIIVPEGLEDLRLVSLGTDLDCMMDEVRRGGQLSILLDSFEVQVE